MRAVVGAGVTAGATVVAGVKTIEVVKAVVGAENVATEADVLVAEVIVGMTRGLIIFRWLSRLLFS